MRKIFALLAVVAAVAACDSRIGGSFVAPTNNINGNFMLRTLNGDALPAVWDSSASTVIRVVGDTLTFNSDGTVREAIAFSTTTLGGSPVPSKTVTTGAYSLSGTALDLTLPTTGNTFSTFHCTYISGKITLNDARGVWIYTR